jgi:hypothetical protein
VIQGEAHHEKGGAEVALDEGVIAVMGLGDEPGPDRFQVGGQGGSSGGIWLRISWSSGGRGIIWATPSCCRAALSWAAVTRWLKRRKRAGDVALRLKQFMILRLMPINIGGG